MCHAMAGNVRYGRALCSMHSALEALPRPYQGPTLAPASVGFLSVHGTVLLKNILLLYIAEKVNNPHTHTTPANNGSI